MDFQMNLFDLFGADEAKEETVTTAKAETKAEVKTETNTETKAQEVSVEQLNNETTNTNGADAEVKDAPATPSADTTISTTPGGLSFQESLFDDDDDSDSDAATSSDDDDKKDDKKSKSKGTTKKVDTVDGPVSVVGFGWTLTYGDEGKKYKPADVAKAVFEMGYKEMACASFKYKGNTLYVETVSKNPSADNEAMGDEITVGLGNFNVRFTPDMFAELDPKEISLFDVNLACVKANPDFKGCGLSASYGAKFAVPTFTKKITPAKTKTYKVWTENGVVEVSGETLVDNTCYVSDTGVVFAIPAAPKSAQNAYGVKVTDEVSAKKAEELYRLPFTIWLENFGKNNPCTSEHFDGKESVTKDDVIAFLRGEHRAFSSQTRKLSVIYDRKEALVGVALISGEKGVL